MIQLLRPHRFHAQLQRMWKFMVWVMFGLCALLPLTSWANDEAGRGFIDQIIYHAEDRTLEITGWAGSYDHRVFITNLVVSAGNTTLYQGRMGRSHRQDVADVTGIDAWALSGFHIRFPLHALNAGGTYELHIHARRGDGKSIHLSTANTGNQITIAAAPHLAWWQQTALAALLTALLIVVLHTPAPLPGTKASRFSSEHTCMALLLTLFAGLVAFGISGSSLPLLWANSDLVQQASGVLGGTPRGIRSDEWEVITPMALSQGSHLPAYPVVNTLWGAQGHNMLVVGMNGVPVIHPTALAKPATWGFFVFDMPKALAWYWWVPFFACLLTAWRVLVAYFELDWRLAFALALAFTFTPYSVGFSGWPAYVSFFPLLGLLVLHRLFQHNSVLKGAALGVVLGLAAAGFALTLYPAWQISVTYLLAPFFVCWFWSHRKTIQTGRAQALGLAIAAATAALLMASWWLDARDAVNAMRSTVYPGGRMTEIGGDIDPWFFLKGWLSIQTMYAPSPLMDPSDAGSFIALPIAALAGTLHWTWRQRQLPLHVAVIVLYGLFAAYFMQVGIPHTLAKWSLWGSVTSYRLDLALSLTQMLLLGWLCSTSSVTSNTAGDTLRSPAPHQTQFTRWLALACAGLSVLYALHLYRLLPSAIVTGLVPAVVLTALAALALASYWLVVSHYRAAVWILCLWTLVSSASFNPAILAPKEIPLSSPLVSALQEARKHGTHENIAILDERTWSLMLPIAGHGVTNSVFYHPPLEFWSRLDPEHQFTATYNRYQRLFFQLDTTLSEGGFRIHSPRLDEVILSLNAGSFDFTRLGSSAVLAPIKHLESLQSNPSLELQHRHAQWVLFRVKTAVQANKVP